MALAGALVAAAMTLYGCTGMIEQPTALPARNSIVFDQLTIYSNFALPRHHRLLDDLRVQRGELLGKLNLPASDEPIHVYLFETEEKFDDFLSANHPEFPQRRAFFVESDMRLAVYAQWGERVAEDLRHEVAHGYLHSVIRNMPLWLDEGIAEYCEVPRGTGGVNHPHVKLLLAKLTQQNWRPDLPRLEQLNSAGSMTQDDYAESWAWAHWLLETDPRRRVLLQQYLQTLRESGTAMPLSLALRQSEPKADQSLVEHLYSLTPKP
jgi:hypothetical protein